MLTSHDIAGHPGESSRRGFQVGKSEAKAGALRIEGFNIFNRAQYGNPNGNFSSASFGQITTTVNGASPVDSGTPREFQLAMRLTF
jgi:hypothetical protein